MLYKFDQCSGRIQAMPHHDKEFMNFVTASELPYSNLDSPGYNLDWPTAVAGEADSVSSVSASACHIGGPI